MSGGGHPKATGGGIQKMLIVLLLTGGVFLMHRFASRPDAFDPSAMLALGFVILASYAFGSLVERVGLPHITGYLIAGLALGPSTAHLLPEAWHVPPFDDGILSASVIDQLSPLNTLAVALIALTAGGELKIESLKKGLGTIVGMLGGQIIVLLALCVAFVVGLSGVIPGVELPSLGRLDLSAAVALGAVVGAISIATSPAATIAVINDLRARGPMTSAVLATVVLKDVVVVVLFAVLSTFAAQTLGVAGSDEALGLYLLKHIGGALVLGGVIGGGVALYLRYINAEVLLFVVGVVYTAAYVAGALDVEAVVLFITAGFVTANFSSEGDHLVETVEKLSLPVYVVFFTLAGAKLHLEELFLLWPYVLALVAIRTGGLWLGTAIGSALGGAPTVIKKRGWLGFVSQAGVAISLASIIGRRMGPAGEALSTLIIASIAINELIGPVALKVGLSGAGEADGGTDEEEPEPAPAKPAPEEEDDEPSVQEWPQPDRGADAWGAPLVLAGAELEDAARELQLDLSHVARDVAEEPLARFRDDALGYVRELRREFLRHHRRITVQAQGEPTELSAAEALRLEQAELAEKWRATVLTRAARVQQTPGWEAAPIVAAVDAISEGLPEKIEAPYEQESFLPREEDGLFTSFSRMGLRARRGARRMFGEEMAPRTVELRALARYHLWGMLPERLEPVAALYVQAEGHLVSRTRSIFEGLVQAYDSLASDVESAQREALRQPREEGEAAPTGMPEEELERRLRDVRAEVDEELVLAVQEIDRIADDLAIRTSLAIGQCLRELKDDLPLAATPDMPMRRRAASRLYKRRDEALRWLERGTAAARETSSAVYNRLALEMELHALEGRVKDALEEHATALGRDVRGRAHRQVQRVEKALVDAQAEMAGVLAEEDASAMAERVRALTEPVVRVAAEAARVATRLRDQLADERSVTPVLDALTRAAQGLTDRYRVPAGPMPRGEHRLPPPVNTVEVPFRDWVMARIETSLAPRLLSSTRDVALKVEPLSHALSELERRVAFNVELAVNELSVVEGEEVPKQTRRLVRDMIGSALERNRELFEGYADDSERWGDEVRRSVRDAVLSSLDELRGGLVDGEVGRMSSQMKRDVRGRRLVRWARQSRRAISRSWAIAGRAVREAIGEARLDRARQRVGLPPHTSEAEIVPQGFAPPEPAPSIPMVYRRLFSAQALEAGDILTGRDDALQRAISLLEDGPAGSLRTVAVVGPDGVGKSAFVNAVIRAKRWPKVRELALEGPATLEQVDALFEPSGEGHLVVVSGVHWLRALQPGGFSALRRFVDRVIQDGGKNAFLVRADTLVWEQSLEAAPLRDAFPDLITLGPLEPEALQAAVLARHTVSGYGLVFSQGIQPESRLEELVMQASSPLSRPQQSFFRALHAASGGLLRDALRLWLASVEEVDEAGDFVHLGPVPTSSLYALRRLGEREVLTLYQVARQGWMDVSVCASLFRIDETTARARLMALGHVGILERRGAVWRIALHLRGTVQRLLREKGFIA